MVSTTCDGGARKGWLVRRMKERASFTNAVVSTAPAPIRNPRRDCCINNPPEWHTHLEDWRPTVAHRGPHRRATVAGLRLVGGADQALSGCRLMLAQVPASSKRRTHGIPSIGFSLPRGGPNTSVLQARKPKL